MSSVRPVPETELLSGDVLSADDAWQTVRHHGLRRLAATAFQRFRYGDGFSHARAFAMQLALATVRTVLAGAALAGAVGVESGAEVVARTVVALSPGNNVGVLLIVAGEPFGEALEQVYHWGDAAETGWDIVRWPLGVAALAVAVTAMFQHSPRRKQPGLSWLAVGAAVTVLAWLVGSGLLALYVVASGGFGEVYGPLAAVMALLLWANLTGIALLAGIALAAQVEALRADLPDPLLADTDDDGIPDELDEHPNSPAR